MRSVREMRSSGKSRTLESLWEVDFLRKPIGIQQFLEDDYYLGKMTENLFPKVKDALISIFHHGADVQEVICAGGIGWGKTLMSAIGLTYIVYQLSCLRNPHQFYNLTEGSSIVVGIYSVTKTQAYDSSYSKVRTFVDESPYFRENYPRVQRIKSKIVFQNGPVQVIAGSTELHTVGLDLIAFLLDEANFLQAKSSKEDGDSMALRIYNNARTRVKSRFMRQGGGTAGVVFLVSSKKTHRSFLEKHIESVKDDIKTGSTLLFEYSQWEVRDPDLYTKPKFEVEIGDQVFPSRILRDGENPRPGADTIIVPGEYSVEFEADVDQALRDIAGVATYGISPLIHNKQAIYDCCEKKLRHPFVRQVITLSDRTDTTLDHYFTPEVMFYIRRSRYTVQRCPASPRFVHVDLGLTGDAAGLASAYVSGFKPVRRQRGDGTFFVDQCPRIGIDFVLRIKPPGDSGEIDISKIRSFVISLRDLGLPIIKVTADGFQGRDFMQIMRKLGFESNVYSVDRNDEPYLYLRQAILERRLEMYEYKPLIIELSELERDIDKRKVDHPKTSSITGDPGSKDIADALCGAVAQCMIDPRVSTTIGSEALSSERDTDGGYVVSEVTSKAGTIDWSDIEKDVRRL